MSGEHPNAFNIRDPSARPLSVASSARSNGSYRPPDHFDTSPPAFTSTSRSNRLEIGDVIDDRYVIEAITARGSMGWVYRTRHQHMDRTTAVKVLDIDQPLLDARRYRDRFQHEARAAAALDHPNVIRVFDFGFMGARRAPYIAMQYLEGHDLNRELGEGPLSSRRALRLIEHTLLALSAAHDLGIVHKDIKPSNLFVQHAHTTHEHLVVLDFGVARIQNNTLGGGITRLGEIAGTPEYLPPEYITRQQVSPAIDVYSTALVLIELFMGEPVIKGASPVARLMEHLRGAISIPEPLANSVLAPVLRRALAPDPVDRFQNAAVFLDALRACQADFFEEVASGLLGALASREHPQNHSRIASRVRAVYSRPQLPLSPHNDALSPSQSTPATVPPGSLLAAPPAPRFNETSSGFGLPERLDTALSPSDDSADPEVSFKQLFNAAVTAAGRRAYRESLRLFRRCDAIRPGHRLVIYNIRTLERRIGDHQP